MLAVACLPPEAGIRWFLSASTCALRQAHPENARVNGILVAEFAERMQAEIVSASKLMGVSW